MKQAPLIKYHVGFHCPICKRDIICDWMCPFCLYMNKRNSRGVRNEKQSTIKVYGKEVLERESES